MRKLAHVLARLAFVGAIGLAAATSGPQAALADEAVTCNLADPVASCVMPYVALVEETVSPEGPILYCQPDTGRCCSYNPRDPKGTCVPAPPTCETDPSLCPPPGETGQ